MSIVNTFFAQLVDYAGLFPPAGLDMPTAVANFDRYVRSDCAWILGRLIIPLSRLDEFEAAAVDLLPTADADGPWLLSALLGPIGECDFADAFDRIARFNESHRSPANGRALIDAVELKAGASSQIDDALDALPDGIAAFFEIPSSDDPRGMIAALAGSPGRAKIRTGGVTPDLIPSTPDVVTFLHACADARVPFKATAGLHHPIRGVHPLTYEPDAPAALTHGFINLFFAAAALFSRCADEATASAILDESDLGAFSFDDFGAAWRDIRLDGEHLARARETFCLSFGSCSFEEPVNDLINLGLL